MRQDVPTRATALGDLWRPQGPRYVVQPQQGQAIISKCPRIMPPGPNAGPFAFTTYLTQLQYLSSIGCPAYNEVSAMQGLGDGGLGWSKVDYTRWLRLLSLRSGQEARVASDVHGLGAMLDPGATAAVVAGSALSAATLPTIIGLVLYAVKKKSAAKTLFVIAGIAGAVGGTTALFAAESYAKNTAGEL